MLRNGAEGEVKMVIETDFSFKVIFPKIEEVKGIMRIESNNNSEGRYYTTTLVLDSGFRWKAAEIFEITENDVFLACSGNKGTRQALVDRMVKGLGMEALHGAKVA